MSAASQKQASAPTSSYYSSPYFLSSSANPGNILVSCLLNGENYPTWRWAMSNALRAMNKFCFVDGSLPKPNAENPDVKVWEICNSMVISWLFNSIAPGLHASVAYFEDAHDMWDDLEQRFSQGSNTQRAVHELKREIARARQGNSSVAAYFAKLNDLWEELGTYSKVPKCTCVAAKDFDEVERDQVRLHQFLMGLNDCYSDVCSQILSMEPLPRLNSAYALVCKEEKQQVLIASRERSIESAVSSVVQYLNGIHGGNTKNGFQEQSTTSKRYEHCKCFELVGYPAGWQSRGRFLKEHPTLSNIQEKTESSSDECNASSSSSSSYRIVEREEVENRISRDGRGRSGVGKFSREEQLIPTERMVAHALGLIRLKCSRDGLLENAVRERNLTRPKAL
ncbi:hypothetical protein SLEP1_g60049 [Rubroshorea leprosula]|uniref:Retrotransposon Copia-like N-terminal domain-containing protein n=1 Tax=Rubroshorea leprosula TaxID=152421 RepID=A0AAV5MXD7_9ROSI|nr:hypothetical protein SLEP1_g60049 [Rubroshorea leprosula]